MPKTAADPPGASPAPPKGARPATRLVPTLAALLAVAVGLAAGHWQQRRMEQKQALRVEIDAAARSMPLALESLPADADWASLRYRPVRAAGRYLGERQIFIDNRVVAGRAGYDVVAPLVLDDGRAVLVVRGWVALPASRSTLPDNPPPAGRVSVRGRLVVPPSRYFELGRDAAAGPVWQHLDPSRFAARTGLPVLPAVIEQSEVVPDDGLVRAWTAPDLGIETHRIYMVQWYTLAALAFALWVWFHRPGRPHRAR